MMRHGRCDKGAGGHRLAEDLDHCWGVLLGAFMAVLNIQITRCNLPLRRGLAQLQQFFTTQGTPDPASAMHRAMVAVGNSIRAETTYIGYADCFALLDVVLLCAIAAVAMLKKGTVAAGGAH